MDVKRRAVTQRGLRATYLYVTWSDPAAGPQVRRWSLYILALSTVPAPTVQLVTFLKRRFLPVEIRDISRVRRRVQSL